MIGSTHFELPPGLVKNKERPEPEIALRNQFYEKFIGMAFIAECNKILINYYTGTVSTLSRTE